MYFAVTSNTAQFGAKLELYASAWKFNVYGFLSFDVLFQFNPFYFIAEITAMLALRVGSSSFASIKLTLTLEGPTPWKAQGTAQVQDLLVLHAEGAVQQDVRGSAQHDVAGSGGVAVAGGSVTSR